MSLLVPVYVVYALVSVTLVAWLAQTLYRNGEVFLADVFSENPQLAPAVNRLLVIGFYMANLGYAALLLHSAPPADAAAAIEALVHKLGVLLLSLAALHFTNMYVFYRLRRRATAVVLPPPVVPQAAFAVRHR